MGSISTFPDFIDALRTALAARSGMSGVTVWTGPVDAEAMGVKSVVFASGEVSAGVAQPMMGGLEHFENYPVDGEIWVTYPGAGETSIAGARDLAFDILEEVYDYMAGLTSTAATIAAVTVDKVDLSGWTLAQWPEQGERHCRLKFSIEARGRFTPA